MTGRRRILGLVVALSLAAPAVTAAGASESAYAATTQQQETAADNNGIAHVRWDLGPGPTGNDQAHEYDRMINAVRHAAGHNWRRDMLETTDRTHRLVVVEVHLHHGEFGGTDRLNLYFTAADMYLRGWESPDDRTNTVVQFGSYDLALRLPGTHRIHRLGFGEAYPSIESTAELNRQRLRFNRNNLFDSVLLLHRFSHPNNHVQPRDVARSVLRLVVAIAEAARFGGIAGTIGGAIRSNSERPLGDTNVALTNNWDRLSRWGRNETRDPVHTPPLGLGQPLGTINHVGDLEHYVYMIQSGHGNVHP